MKQTNKILIIAALLLAGAFISGCSVINEELETTPLPQDGNSVTLTTRVSFDATTKALDAGGVKTFAVGDQIAIFYTDSLDDTQKAVTLALTADDISDGGKTALFTVTLKKPQPGTDVRYVYPAAMASDDGYDIGENPRIDSYQGWGTFNLEALDTQDGTLESLSDGLDLCYFDGSLTNEARLPENTTLENLLAICKFTIKDADGSDITSTISTLTVNDGVHTYNVVRNPAAGPVYVAMLTTYNRRTIRFYAVTNDGNVYEKCVTGKDISVGKMYPVGLKMTMDGRDILFGDAGIPGMEKKVESATGTPAESLTDNDILDYIFNNPFTVVSNWPGWDNSRTDPNTDDSLDDADLLVGGGDNDILFGQGNNDVLFGDTSANGILGWTGFQLKYYSVENVKTFIHSMEIASLNEELNSLENESDGDDILFGGIGDDMLFGLGGNDKLYGNIGDDFIFGGSGDDILSGGEGNDYLCGGEGVDIILFSSDDNIDGGDGIDILLCNSEYDSWEYIENVYNVELLLKVTEGLVFDNWGHGDIWTIPDLLNMTINEDDVVLTISDGDKEWKNIVTGENGITTITFTYGEGTIILETTLSVTVNPEDNNELILSRP